MRTIGLLLIAVLCGVCSETVPVQVYHDVETPAMDLVVVGNGVSQEAFDGDEDYEDLTENAMGKRSIALGRSGFRPGKRSVDNFHTVDVSDLIMKRSMAIGRLGLRPGKRSMAYGRQGFRPGKRSMAYGRQGFRPGKRSMAYGRQGFRPGKRSGDVMAAFPRNTPEIYIL